jgi:sulfatase maturation enzyme AslB (radical SAM superfamily)
MNEIIANFIRKDDKPVEENTAVNVIYFTNVCNLACKHCYQDLANRPPQILTKQDIEQYVDGIIEREDPDKQTLIVLFGGEPTLQWENVCYLMEYAYSKKKNVHFNLETNGIKFLSDKFTQEVKENFFYKRGFMSIDVSFDGVGNGNRIFHDGSDSTSAMITVFKKLMKNRMGFRVRYTIHNNNIKFFYDDINRIIKTFKPLRVITSIAWDTLSDEDQQLLLAGKNRFRTDWINRDNSIPVCEFFCDMCSGCGVVHATKTYFTDEGNVTTYKYDESALKFHDFKEKENENEYTR